MDEAKSTINQDNDCFGSNDNMPRIRKTLRSFDFIRGRMDASMRDCVREPNGWRDIETCA